MIRRVPLYVQILAAMFFGAATGQLMGPSAGTLGELGKVLIQLIKALAGPLLFFAVIDALVRTRIHGRAAAVMLAISLVNAAAALFIGLSISNVMKPGASLAGMLRQPVPAGTELAGFASRKIDFMQALTGLVPQSVVQPFVENSVIGIILLAALFGLALRKIKTDENAQLIERGIAICLNATEVSLGWIIRFVPIAVFGVVAKTVGTQGFAPVKGLATYVGVALLGLAIQIGVLYQGWLLATLGFAELKRFWRGARDAVVYALGASSSLATLPVTLRCLERMEVSTESARLAACVGTNLNHDGILLYEAMAVLFVAQVHGMHLSLSQQLLAALSCLVAGLGIAGIPDAGLISLALVLSTVGLPTELLPLLLTVDWILSRARATTNVISDMVLARLLDRFAPPRPRA